MIRINLVPEPVSATNNRIVFTELGVLAAIFLISYYSPGVYSKSIREEAAAIKADTQSKEAEIGQLRSNSKRIDALKSEIADLNARSNRIRSLTVGRQQPVYILDKLQQQHPDRLWLNTISLDAGTMRITGYATETELISDYATRIKSMSDSSEETSIDLENFTPPFAEYLKKGSSPQKTEALQNDESTLPVNVSNLTIKKFARRVVENTPAYEFEIIVNINMPGGT